MAAYIQCGYEVSDHSLPPKQGKRKERGDFISIPWYQALSVIHCANNCISMFIS